MMPLNDRVYRKDASLWFHRFYHIWLGLLVWIVVGCNNDICDAFSQDMTASSTRHPKRIDLGTMKDLSPISFGTLSIDPMSKGFRNVLEVLPDQTLMDTAEIYGPNKNGQTEKDLSNALSMMPEDKTFRLATKFAPLPWRRSSSSVVKACQASLQRMEKDSIDLYQIHYADRGIFGYAIQDELFWDGIASCYEKGLISNVGVCNYGPSMIHRAYDALTVQRGIPIVSNQINYSLSRYHQDPILRQTIETCCCDLNISILAYSPLANGLLSNSYDEQTIQQILTTNPNDQFGNGKSKARRMKWYVKNSQPLLTTLQLIATQRSVSSAQVAINWILSYKPPNHIPNNKIIPIVGTSKVDHAEDILKTLEWKLSPDEVQSLNEAAKQSAPFAKGFQLK